MATTVIQTGSPAPHMMAMRKERWSTGLCDCCAFPGGCGLFCVTWCCPCITAGQNNQWLKGCGGFIGGMAPYFAVYIAVIVSSWWFAAMGQDWLRVHYSTVGGIWPSVVWGAQILPAVFLFMHGQSTAEKLNIGVKENACMGVMKAWCCSWCYLCQVRREQMIADRNVLPVMQPAYGAPGAAVVV